MKPLDKRQWGKLSDWFLPLHVKRLEHLGVTELDDFPTITLNELLNLRGIGVDFYNVLKEFLTHHDVQLLHETYTPKTLQIIKHAEQAPITEETFNKIELHAGYPENTLKDALASLGYRLVKHQPKSDEIASQLSGLYKYFTAVHINLLKSIGVREIEDLKKLPKWKLYCRKGTGAKFFSALDQLLKDYNITLPQSNITEEMYRERIREIRRENDRRRNIKLIAYNDYLNSRITKAEENAIIKANQELEETY